MPKVEINIPRLCTAIHRSRMALKRTREERREMVRQYVANHWSEEGTAEKIPVNLISMYVSIIGRKLIAKNPRVMLSTFDKSIKPIVNAMQTWANKEIKTMRLADTLRRAVVDALFNVGICKVALATPDVAAKGAWATAAGMPFAERVDLDDFVYDIHARDFRESSFIGHRFRVPIDAVKDSKIYSSARKKLEPSRDNPYNLEGDERIGMLGRGYTAGVDEEFEDWVDLWEIYLPRHKVIVTLTDNLTGSEADADDEPLRQQGWVGPDSGPYHMLAFGVVPGNAMPKAPIQDLIDLHQAVNETYRKVIRTVSRIKENFAVASGAAEDANRIINADDGEFVLVNNPERIKPVVFSGAALQPILAVATVLKDLFGEMGGNLRAIGGLGPQSKTASQDKMLEENSSQTVTDMQDSTINFVAEVASALCWYWWNHPQLVQKTKFSLPGLPHIEIPRYITPQLRQQGYYDDLDIEIDPYSLMHQTPQTRMAALNQVVQQTILPMMQLMVQQGVNFDINAYLVKIGKFMDMPDLQDIVNIIDAPTQDSAPAQPEGPTMPAQTERTYNRVSRSDATDEGQNKNLVPALLGVNTGGNGELTRE